MVGLGQHICLSQPAFYSAGRILGYTHHNHMMLKLIPNIMTTSSCISHLHFSHLPYMHILLLFYFFFCSFQLICPLLIPPTLFSYSIISLSLLLNFQLYPEVSVQPQLPLFFCFFDSPAAVSFQYNSNPHNRALVQQHPPKASSHWCLHTTPR